MPNSAILKEVFLLFVNEETPYNKDDEHIFSNFDKLELKSLEVISQKIQSTCDIYKEYLNKIFDCKNECIFIKLIFFLYKIVKSNFDWDLPNRGLKEMLDPKNNKFVLSVSNQVCEKIKKFKKNPLFDTENENQEREYFKKNEEYF